ncbi:glycosyltransferase [Burkholderia sp. FERM BP-3421]|jgi:tetratricopeptide (TPR) repeat protein|uniref:glycosyltransferase n=1 Tax=Burkholderia sp. FERM BP-3421 TaxID=1494466 RepID=UPI002361F632|nr:glycosyltransferase [Burkholderia sp. FERM BP-3421]WDD90885.1 glycosyltransferase [Burkholderia sp. FERM BP-3421]
MLTACLIVHNEARVLARCLTSLAPWIDACCIVDSGSTDETVDIARQFGAQARVMPSLADARGRMIDFAAARNAALAMAGNGWILSVDADEVLAIGDRAEWRRLMARRDLQAIELVILSGGTRWYLPRVFRKQPWSTWHGRVHEWIVLREPTCRTNCATLSNHPDKAGKESAVERDLRLCAQALRDDPDDLRAVLYHARALRLAKRHAEAIPLYLRYWRQAEFQAGRYTAVLGAATCALLMRDLEASRRYALAAYRIDPDLAEACCVLGDVALGMGRADLAVGWFEKALRKPLPGTAQTLFVDESCYGPYPRDRLRWIRERLQAR